MSVSREEFAAAFADTPLAQLREQFEAETGRKLQARSKAAAIDEVYAAWLEMEASEAPSAPASALPEPPAAEPPPPPEPEPEVGENPHLPPEYEAQLAVFEPAVPPPTPEPEGPLEFEARSRTGQAFHKGGRRFGPAWAKIGPLTDDERHVLDKFAKFVQYRVKR